VNPSPPVPMPSNLVSQNHLATDSIKLHTQYAF
jgi:hypothetical protein